MITEHIEQAIRNIEAEKEQQIADLRTEIMRDKIMPKNAKIDDARDKAIQALQTKLNIDIAALQEKYAKERQSIIEASEKQKSENTNSIINAETANLAYEYDKKLASLKKLLEA